MAASSGQPQGAKTKKEFTAEQKRTFGMLGVLGVLALIAGAIYIPGMLSGGGDTEVPTAPQTASTEGTPATEAANPDVPTGALTESGANAGANPGAGGAAPTGTAVSYAPVGRFRNDPFAPFIADAPPLPPVPTPVPPIPIPPPLEVPQPTQLDPFFVPGPGAASQTSAPAMSLPPINIPRITSDIKSPRDAFPPARSTSGGNNVDPEPSYDKRLSGVVIANGVRALLEITSGGELKSYVVQPGDTVEGITVLNISRFSEGTNTVTRMLIRENGQERYVDLKPAPQRAGGLGEGGFPGAQ